MWAAWMVTLNGWLAVLGLVLALAGCVLFGLVVKDEFGRMRNRTADRARAKRRAADRSR